MNKMKEHSPISQILGLTRKGGFLVQSPARKGIFCPKSGTSIFLRSLFIGSEKKVGKIF